jgi:hypothetical protein
MRTQISFLAIANLAHDVMGKMNKEGFFLPAANRRCLKINCESLNRLRTVEYLLHDCIRPVIVWDDAEPKKWAVEQRLGTGRHFVIRQRLPFSVEETNRATDGSTTHHRRSYCAVIC